MKKSNNYVSNTVKVELNPLKMEQQEIISEKVIKNENHKTHEDYEVNTTVIVETEAAELISNVKIEAGELITDIIKIEEDEFHDVVKTKDYINTTAIDITGSINNATRDVIISDVKMEKNTTFTDNLYDSKRVKIEFIDCSCKSEGLQKGVNGTEQVKCESHNCEEKSTDDNPEYGLYPGNNSQINLFTSGNYCNQQASACFGEIDLATCKSSDENRAKIKHKRNVKKLRQAGSSTSVIQTGQSQIDWFECEFCNYRTSLKNSFKRHGMTVHKDKSQITDDHSKRPVTIHKDLPEIERFRCDLCNFTAKYKSHVKKHMPCHKVSSHGIDCFKCTLCNFRTRHKSSLKTHILAHKDPSRIKWLRCDSCNYKTKRKISLEAHVWQFHRSPRANPPQTAISKCVLCGFRTKYLKSHMLIHKGQ